MSSSLLNLENLISSVQGIQIGNAPCFFNDVQTDSRLVNADSKCMFVPLVGEFQDGHKYIPMVLGKGASVILLNNSEYENNKEKYEQMALENPEVCFVRVNNTLTALQNASERYVDLNFNSMIKVCITGSSGKTTTKEMLVSVAKAYFGQDNVTYTKGNYNSETGLPLSVFAANPEAKIGIFEMGMNRENEIKEISKVLKANYGIITNIGNAHIGILGSQENIAKEKRHAFDYIKEDGAAFVPYSDAYGDFCLENVKGKALKFGPELSEEESGVRFLKEDGLLGTDFLLDGLEIHLPIPGSYNFSNALGVIALAKELGMDAESIKSGIENFNSVNGRMEVVKTKLKTGKEILIIKDCYNANPDSMAKAIELCNSYKTSKKKFYILGDMKELGTLSECEHRKIGNILNKVCFSKLFLLGPEMDFAYQEMELKDNRDVFYFGKNCQEDFFKISEHILKSCENDDVVLLKGSRSMQIEKLLPLIEKSNC